LRVAKNITAVPPVRASRPKPAHRNGDVLVESGCAEPVLGAAGVAPLSVAPETFELTPDDRLEPEILDWLVFRFATGVSPVTFDVANVVVGVAVSGAAPLWVGVAVAVEVVLSVGVTLAVSVAVALDVAVSVTVTVGVVMTTGAETTTASSPQTVATLELFESELVKAAIQLNVPLVTVVYPVVVEYDPLPFTGIVSVNRAGPTQASPGPNSENVIVP